MVGNLGETKQADIGSCLLPPILLSASISTEAGGHAGGEEEEEANFPCLVQALSTMAGG